MSKENDTTDNNTDISSGTPDFAAGETPWNELMRVGDYPQGSVTLSDIKTMAANYKAELHEAPLRVTHDPKVSPYSHGWVSALKVTGASLYGKFRQVSTEMREYVKAGMLKHKSIGIAFDIITDKPYLHHVAALGADAPAVKGMQPLELKHNDNLKIITFTEEPQEETMAVIDLKEYKGFTPEMLAILKKHSVEITQPPEPGKNPELVAEFAEFQKERQAFRDERLKFADERFGEKLNGIVQKGIITKPIADMCIQIHRDYIRKTDGNLITFTGETETTETIGDYMIKTLSTAKPMVGMQPVKFQTLDVKTNGDGKDKPVDPLLFNEQGETVEQEAARTGGHPVVIANVRKQLLLNKEAAK